MPALFTNNATATLAASVSSSGTTVVLTTGQGPRFPALSAGEYFYGTLFDANGNYEIVKVTARVSDSLTVVRAQDDTIALAFNAGDGFALRPVAAVLTNFAQLDSDNTFQGATTLQDNLSGTTATFSGAISSVSPSFTGTPTVPTASSGTNTTQAASTAFVKNAVDTATGNLGTMSTQNANNVNITGGVVANITDLAVADGGTGRSTLAANAVLVGNGTSAINSVAPGSAGNVLTSNGTAWVSGAAPAPTSGTGSIGNNSNFTVTTGSSGVALITVEFLTLASYGNFGGATGYLNYNGNTVASKYTQTIEYSSRNSGCGGTILYRFSGSANTSYTFNFTWGGTGYLHSASYMFMGI